MVEENVPELTAVTEDTLETALRSGEGFGPQKQPQSTTTILEDYPGSLAGRCGQLHKRKICSGAPRKGLARRSKKRLLLHVLFTFSLECMWGRLSCLSLAAIL